MFTYSLKQWMKDKADAREEEVEDTARRSRWHRTNKVRHTDGKLENRPTLKELTGRRVLVKK